MVVLWLIRTHVKHGFFFGNVWTAFKCRMCFGDFLLSQWSNYKMSQTLFVYVDCNWNLPTLFFSDTSIATSPTWKLCCLFQILQLQHLHFCWFMWFCNYNLQTVCWFVHCCFLSPNRLRADSGTSEIGIEDRQRRAEHLRRQRDKLLGKRRKVWLEMVVRRIWGKHGFYDFAINWDEGRMTRINVAI